MNIGQLSLTRTNQSTPPVDLQLAYAVNVNNPQKNATVRTFAVKGVQNQKQILSSELTSPMNLSWGGTAQNIPDSTLKVLVTDFDFAEWKALLGNTAPAGKFNLTLNVASQNSGKLLNFDLNSQADGVTAKFGTNQIAGLALRMQSKGQGTELKKFNLENYRLELARQGQSLATISGSGQYDQSTTAANLDTAIEANLAGFAKALPTSGAKVSSGQIQAKAHIGQKGQSQTVTGNLLLDQLNAAIGSNQLQNFAATVDLDIQKNGSQLEIRKADGNLRQGNNPGGRFETKGSMNLEKKAVQLDFNLVDLNQNVLRPFLQQAMQGKQLVSMTINARASTKYDPEKDSSIKGSFHVNKLVVNDPEKRVPPTPLEARLELDSSIHQKRLDLRQCNLTLTPTQRAKNEVQLKGQVDASETNAIQGKLTLFAETLDLTPYYDLFTGGKKSAAPEEETPEPAADEQPKPPPPNPPLPPEPPAKKLPFKNFVFDGSIGRFYLREVEVTNLLTELKLDGGKVLLDPLQMFVNGAPVKGTVDLDLGVRRYQYAVNFNADAVPLLPIANSLMPRYKDKAKGNVNGRVQIKGAGTTGINLQKTLAGQLNLACTNAQIQFVGKKNKKWVRVISSVLRVPEIQTAPITAFNAQTLLGEGKINIKTVDVDTAAFTAHTEGSIPIAKVLTNSPIPNIPVQFALRRSLAEKGNVLPPETPADAAFVQLPNFLRLTGTVGDPEVHTDKVVILALIARSQAGRFGGQGGKILDALGNLGGGRSSGANTNNAPNATNKPPTQPSNPVGNILDNIFKKPKEQSK